MDPITFFGLCLVADDTEMDDRLASLGADSSYELRAWVPRVSWPTQCDRALEGVQPF